MGFSRFASLSLEKAIEQETAPDDLWIFVHIPKTAGSSFAYELSEWRRPYRRVRVDDEDTITPHKKKLERAVSQFIEDCRTTPYRACSGHMNMRHVLRIREALPGARIVSMLRHPVERVISDFRYARTPSHPPHKEFIRRFPTIESYVDSPASQNKMFRILTPDPNITMDKFYEYLDENISFVGITELYPMSVNITARLFGVDLLPISHKRNKTETTVHNEVERSPALLRRIREVNDRDVGLYRLVRDRLIARREQWLASRGVRSLS